MVVTSAATCGPATRCSKRMKRSGEGSRPCCPLCSCSTSLRTADRRRGRTHPPDGRRTRLGRGGGVMADPLLSGRVPTQRSNRSQLLRSNPYPGFPGRSRQQLQLTGNARDYNVVVGSSLTARGQPAIEPIDVLEHASVTSPAGFRTEGRNVPENQSGGEVFNSAADSYGHESRQAERSPGTGGAG